MTTRFHYLSPIVFPLLPSAVGKTTLGVNVASMLDELASDDDRVEVVIDIKAFADGAEIDRQVRQVELARAAAPSSILEWSFQSETLGYLEVTITANRPYFRNLLTECVFALVERVDGGSFNVHSQFKFSDPVVIDMMERIGQFCLVHPAQHVSKADNAGNSVVIVNPFDGAVQARLTTAGGKSMAKRIRPHHAMLVSLHDIIGDGEWACVLYTGNNRYPAWDVRHAYADQLAINRLDHMEYFRGNTTMRPVPFGRYVRSHVRRLMRRMRLRYN